MKSTNPPQLTQRLTMNYLEAIAPLLRMLAHPHRLRIVEFLKQENEAPVHQLIKGVSIPQANLSLHLNQMKRMGLLRSERKGREIWYKIKDPRVLDLFNCISSNGPTEGIEHGSKS